MTVINTFISVVMNFLTNVFTLFTVNTVIKTIINAFISTFMNSVTSIVRFYMKTDSHSYYYSSRFYYNKLNTPCLVAKIVLIYLLMIEISVKAQDQSAGWG